MHINIYKELRMSEGYKCYSNNYSDFYVLLFVVADISQTQG